MLPRKNIIGTMNYSDGKEDSITIHKDNWEDWDFRPLTPSDPEEKYELASKNIAYINMNTMPDDSTADFIDIPLNPTVNEIRNGQDIWMEKAILYIFKGLSAK
jgi:hypothetical protein